MTGNELYNAYDDVPYETSQVELRLTKRIEELEKLVTDLSKAVIQLQDHLIRTNDRLILAAL